MLSVLQGMLDERSPNLSLCFARYDQTDLILREYYESGTDSDRGSTAMARMNAIHGMYGKEISNADMLFTLSLFVTEPARWIDRQVASRPCNDEKGGGVSSSREDYLFPMILYFQSSLPMS